MKKLYVFIFVVIALLCCLSSCNNEKNEECSTPIETVSDGIHFGTVSDLLAAIKHDPYHYMDKEVEVQGTLCKFGSETLLFDRPLTSSSASSSGVAFRYEAENSPNIEITISDETWYTVAESGDYFTVSGTVKISDGKIHLDNCTYTFNS